MNEEVSEVTRRLSSDLTMTVELNEPSLSVQLVRAQAEVERQRLTISDLARVNVELVAQVHRLERDLREMRRTCEANSQRLAEVELDLKQAIMERKAQRTCLQAGPGRGDCEHFIGWPAAEDETTTDECGVPFGWCIVCYWRHKALEKN